MSGVETDECRYFVSHGRVDLPPILVGATDAAAFSHRNTFIRAHFDRAGVLKGFDKVVYGEVELAHRYDYHDNGVIRRAEISGFDEEAVAPRFDEAGIRIARV